jgi:hypothetical protein
VEFGDPVQSQRLAPAVYALSRTMPTPVSLLYRDSYDLDVANLMHSAIHQALELAAARPLIDSETVVCVDEFGIRADGGKGMILEKFFSSVRAEVIYSGSGASAEIPGSGVAQGHVESFWWYTPPRALERYRAN